MPDEETKIGEPTSDEITPPPAPPKGDEPAAAPERRTVEQWAEKKGHIMPGYDPENRYISRSADALLGARYRAFAPCDFNVAKFRKGWPLGAEVTEADYDAAIAEAQSLTAQ